MRNYLIIFFMMVIFLPLEAGISQVTKAQTKQFLTRTNKAITTAHSAIKRGKVHKGDYVNALRHQQFAKKMYIRNQFQKAIYHSKKARSLAFKTITDNGARIPSECGITKEEKAMIGTSVPSDRVLAEEIALDSQHNLKDTDVIDKTVDLTLP
jgi:hypothetical protein